MSAHVEGVRDMARLISRTAWEVRQLLADCDWTLAEVRSVEDNLLLASVHVAEVIASAERVQQRVLAERAPLDPMTDEVLR